ncbi:MAG: carboxypeptidase regulatory-like domain-containing protein [Planctomycetota bacterium]
MASISGKVTFAGENIPEHTVVSARVCLPGQSAQIHFERFSKPYGKLETSFVIDNIEPGVYRLIFRAKGFEDVIIEDVEAPSEGLEVELVSAGKPKLEGTVISSLTGKPVNKFKARARLVKILRGPHYSQRGRWSGFDNAAGRFSVDVVGQGIYQVQISAKGFAWIWSQEISTEDDGDVLIELTPGGTIKGKIINEQGQSLSGAVVIPLSKAGGTAKGSKMFLSQEGAVETTDGQFILENLAEGSETIKISHPNYCIATVNDIEVLDGQTTEGIEVVLSKGGVVEGYVYDFYGYPEPNVVLSVHDFAYYGGTVENEAGRLRTVITDSNGFYRADKLPERKCYLKRRKERSTLGVVRRVIVPIEGQVLKLDFGTGAVLRGKIIVDGEPLAYEEISIKSAGRGERFWSPSFHGRSVAGGDGSFTLAGVPAGKYSVYLQDPQRNVASFRAARVEMGQQDTDVGLLSCERDNKKE